MLKNLLSLTVLLNLLYYHCPLATGSEYKRLDPHGEFSELKTIPKTLEEGSACLICHEYDGKKITLQQDDKENSLSEKCLSCHHKLPHSGALEHLGKDISKLIINGVTPTKINGPKILTCLTCHRAHRFLLPSESELKIKNNSPSFVYFKKELEKNPNRSHLKEERKENSMMKLSCESCHTWSH